LCGMRRVLRLKVPRVWQAPPARSRLLQLPWASQPERRRLPRLSRWHLDHRRPRPTPPRFSPRSSWPPVLLWGSTQAGRGCVHRGQDCDGAAGRPRSARGTAPSGPRPGSCGGKLPGPSGLGPMACATSGRWPCDRPRLTPVVGRPCGYAHYRVGASARPGPPPGAPRWDDAKSGHWVALVNRTTQGRGKHCQDALSTG